MVYVSRTCTFCCVTTTEVVYFIGPDVRNVSYIVACVSSVVFKVVPLESDLGDIPVIDHKPSKLPLFKRQYENKVFIGKSF